MIDKTTSDILLEERIAQIDDINFDKIYDIDDFATKQIENFEQITDFDAIQFVQSNAADYTQEVSASVSEPAFEMELQPNEFLDNYVWNKQEDDFVEVKKEKFKVSNKPLLFTFTSIAVLLCILFIYNVFVINSLEKSVASTAASINASNSNVLVVEEENDYILFENSSKLKIEENNSQNYNFESEETQITNWFDDVCNYVNGLFGGNY